MEQVAGRRRRGNALNLMAVCRRPRLCRTTVAPQGIIGYHNHYCNYYTGYPHNTVSYKENCILHKEHHLFLHSSCSHHSCNLDNHKNQQIDHQSHHLLRHLFQLCNHLYLSDIKYLPRLVKRS